jgi:hypothetical protein
MTDRFVPEILLHETRDELIERITAYEEQVVELEGKVDALEVKNGQLRTVNAYLAHGGAEQLSIKFIEQSHAYWYLSGENDTLKKLVTEALNTDRLSDEWNQRAYMVTMVTK